MPPAGGEIVICKGPIRGGKLFHHMNGSDYEKTQFDENFEKPRHPKPAEKFVNVGAQRGKDYGNQIDWGVIDITKEELGDTKLAQWAGSEIGRTGCA